MEMPAQSTSSAEVALSTNHDQQLVVSARQRVGDTERSATCDELSAQYAAGRLSVEEFEQRVALAMRAITRSDLWELTADLSADLPTATPVAAPVSRSSTARTWPAATVVAVLALIGSLVVAGGLMLVLGLVSPVLFAGAFVGGTAAAIGGGSLAYLGMQHITIRRNVD